MRKVINKMVTEEDLIRTVTAAYAHGLAPGEALLHVRPADRDRRGRAADRRPGQEGHRGRPRGQRQPRHPLHRLDRRVRAQAAHAVPVGGAARARGDRRAGWPSCATRSAATGSTAGRSASATTTASPASSRDCCRAATAGSARVIQAVWEDGGRFDGWSEHFSFDRWMAAAEQVLAGSRVDVDWYTTREREQSRGAALGPPRLRPGQGLALGGLAGLAERGRGRGLPLDALLRLRRLPDRWAPTSRSARRAGSSLPLTPIRCCAA